MKLILKVFLGTCSLFLVSSATAVGLDEILRQGTSVFTDTQGNKNNTIIDAERRKKAIDDGARRQITDLDMQIDANDQRINEELDPQLKDALQELRALERDRDNGAISRSDYVNERRAIDNTVRNLRNSITALKRQNSDTVRRQNKIRADAEIQKEQIDANADANIDQATSRRNTNIFEQIIRDVGR